MTDCDITPPVLRAPVKRPVYRLPVLLSDLVAVVEEALGEGDAPSSVVQAVRVVERITEYLGGAWVWLPDSRPFHRARRDADIWEAFDGRNVLELAERHHLSRQKIYRILRSQRELRRRLAGVGRVN